MRAESASPSTGCGKDTRGLWTELGSRLPAAGRLRQAAGGARGSSPGDPGHHLLTSRSGDHSQIPSIFESRCALLSYLKARALQGAAGPRRGLPTARLFHGLPQWGARHSRKQVPACAGSRWDPGRREAVVLRVALGTVPFSLQALCTGSLSPLGSTAQCLSARASWGHLRR